MCTSQPDETCHHPQFKAWGLVGLRVALGIIFIYMGYSKLGPNHAGATAMMVGIGLPGGGEFWAYLVGALELVGGLMVLLGVYASYAAGWLGVIMIVAMATVHRGSPNITGYFLPLAVLGGCLAILGGGAGQYRLVKTQCRCGRCKGAAGDMAGGCGCGGSCGPQIDKAGEMNKSCACQGCCGSACACGATAGSCGCCGK